MIVNQLCIVYTDIKIKKLIKVKEAIDHIYESQIPKFDQNDEYQNC